MSHAKARADRVKEQLAARRGETFTPKPRATEAPELWPENLPAWGLFERSRTQFICGPMGGALGLKHDALEWKLRMMGVEESEWLETFDKFSIVERIYIASLGKGGVAGGREEAPTHPGDQGRRHRRDRQGRRPA